MQYPSRLLAASLDISLKLSKIKAMKKISQLVVILGLMSPFFAFGQMLMPDLTGLNPDSARGLFSEYKVTYEVLEDSIYVDSLDAGLIAWQFPLPGSPIEDTIKVKPAASLTIELPDLIGMPLMVADEFLETKDIILKSVGEKRSAEIPYGCLVETHPEAGSMIHRYDTVAVLVSIGNPGPPRSAKTSSGVKVNLYEEPEFSITSASLYSSDSAGFTLAFTIKLKNPYPHWIRAEKFDGKLQIDKGAIAKVDTNLVIKVKPKSFSKKRMKIRVKYSDISSKAAKELLAKSEYRCVGTFALVTELGFSREDFDVRGNFNLFASSKSSVKKRLQAIANPVEDK